MITAPFLNVPDAAAKLTMGLVTGCGSNAMILKLYGHNFQLGITHKRVVRGRGLLTNAGGYHKPKV
jgi:hypothetical protein